MPLYVDLDLHANNNYLAIIDRKGKRVDQKKLPNDPALILEVLQPHRTKIVGVGGEGDVLAESA